MKNLCDLYENVLDIFKVICMWTYERFRKKLEMDIALT